MFLSKMFINGLNIGLLLRAWVDKAVHEVEIDGHFVKGTVLDAAANKEDNTGHLLNMNVPIAIGILEKGATVNSVTYLIHIWLSL